MKLLILHKSIEDDIILNNSFNNDCIVRYEKDYNSIENLLNSINDINFITHLAFIYHYPGYCELPYYDDAKNIEKTYRHFSNNIINLINNLISKGLKYVDILSCNLNYDSFIQEIHQIQNDLKINIRYSLDQTGNDPNGNWILESDNIDVKNLYFNSNINNWNSVLNSDIGSSVRAGNYNSIITYNSTTKTFKVQQNFTWDATTMGVATNFIQLTANEIFEGDGYQITATTGCGGFFTINTTGLNTTNRPIIRNIGVIGGTPSSNVGFIVRNNQNFFIVENCYASGNLPDSSYGSAIAGSYTGASAIIRNCFHTGTIGYDAGGIVSDHAYCTIQNCYSTATTLGSFAGGLAAIYPFSCLLQNCYASSGAILGNGSGWNGFPTFQNCYATGTPVGNNGTNFYTVPSGHQQYPGNYQITTANNGTVPVNLNISSTFGAITNTGNAYIADTTIPTGYPLLKVFTEVPWRSSSYTHNNSLPTRIVIAVSEPRIYRRPLTLSNSVELYWYPPSIINSPIDSYIIECSNIPYINIVSSNSRKSTIRNLITGNSYVFTIKASNAYGNGNISEFGFVIPGYKPDFATNLNYSNDISDYSRINFSFNNPQYVGNSAITYNVIKMIPVDISGNILSKSSFIHDHSSLESNIIDPLYDYEYNKNYNYQAYINSINTVNDSNKNYFSTIINPNLPTNGLKLWLDPFDLTTLTLSNSKVTKWEDKSINKANATITESFAPTYDSGNALINFNGLQYLNLPANTLPSANSSYSIFTYVSTGNISRNGQWYLYSGTPTANLSLGGFINSNSIVHSWWTNQLTGNSNISTNISYLIENTFDSGIRRTYLNGILIDQDSVSNRNSGTANNLIGTNSNFTGNLVGSIGDIIIYNRILNNFERSSVNNYLERKKYNLSLQNLGNVISWLDASDPNNFYDINNEFKVSYNDYVYNWLDRSYSNNNASQSNIANLPIRRPYIQNNLDVLEFNQSFLTLPIARYPLDAFIVLKLANISDQNGVLGIGPSSNNYSSLSDISGSRWAIDATSNSLIASTTETSSNFLLMEWSIGNNNNYIRRYGSNIANVTTGTWTLPNNSNIFIGNANGFDFSKKFKGYIGEIMMFNRQLDDSERYPIEGYLAWKWGLQSFLASNHPFKNSAPYLFNKYIVPYSFSPVEINGLSLWLDANDSSTITLSDNNVIQWNDKSGTGLNVTKNTSSPAPTFNTNILNSKPVVNFTIGQFLETPTLNPSLAFTTSGIDSTIFLITRLNGDGINNLTSFGLDTTDNNYVLRAPWSNANKILDIGHRLDFNNNLNNQIVLFSFGRNGTNMFLNNNGSLIGSISNANLSSTVTTLTQKLLIGSGKANGYDGYIAEFIIYKRALSLFERQRIEGYLAWKWGLQSNLPSNHPYKNNAP
jgi:hypothetical protein